MRQSAEGGKNCIIGNPNRISTILRKLLLHACDIVAHNHSLQLNAQLIGQLTTLGQELQTHIGNRALLELDIYKYIIHISSFRLTERVARNKFNHKIIDILVRRAQALSLLSLEDNILNLLHLRG